MPTSEVVVLALAPAAGAAMVTSDRIDVGRSGIVGDRYEGSRHRHISVQSATELADAAAILGKPIPATATRRNVTISSGTVPHRPGARISIGEVELEVVRQAAPCRVMDETIGPGGRAALRRRAGAICRVLVPGRIAVGDTVVVD